MASKARFLKQRHAEWKSSGAIGQVGKALSWESGDWDSVWSSPTGSLA